MSTSVSLPTRYTLILSGQERDGLLGLLRQAIGGARGALTPESREDVLGEQALVQALVEKLERLRPERIVMPSEGAAGIEEGSPVADDLLVDEHGRFQMATADLEDFLRFLLDNEVRAVVETAEAFRAAGEAYGYGRLLHMYDVEQAGTLYRAWRLAHASRATATTA